MKGVTMGAKGVSTRHWVPMRSRFWILTWYLQCGFLENLTAPSHLLTWNTQLCLRARVSFFRSFTHMKVNGFSFHHFDGSILCLLVTATGIVSHGKTGRTRSLSQEFPGAKRNVTVLGAYPVARNKGACEAWVNSFNILQQHWKNGGEDVSHELKSMGARWPSHGKTSKKDPWQLPGSSCVPSIQRRANQQRSLQKLITSESLQKKCSLVIFEGFNDSWMLLEMAPFQSSHGTIWNQHALPWKGALSPHRFCQSRKAHRLGNSRHFSRPRNWMFPPWN